MLLSGQDALRLRRFVEQAERERHNDKPDRRAGGQRWSPECQVVRVTSTTPTAGRYPGKLQLVTAGALADGPDVWVIDVNGGVPAAQKYLARRTGQANARDVFLIDLGGGSASTFSGARVYRTLTQTFADSVEGTLLFGSERFDTDGYHSTVSNTGRLTAPTAAKYLIGGHAAWYVTSVPSIEELRLTLLLNGTTPLASVARLELPINSGTFEQQSLSTLYDLAAGDYVELRAYCQGASVDIEPAPNQSPEFWIARMG